ncbi:MAG TPA: S41 family peptidase [Humisphaera sp.]|jgi:hypothetical protein|nr:S41 family peptidase [Humisphaera sp.]
MRIACFICFVVTVVLSRPIFAEDAPAAAENFATAHLAGNVVDADGKPLRGVKVFFNRATGAPMDMGPAALRGLSALTDERGHYELTLRFKGGPLVVREVFADLDEFVRGAHDALSLALRAGDTATVDFVLHPGQAVSGDVRIPPDDRQLAAGERENQIKHILLVDGPALSGLTANARAYSTQPGGHFEIYLPPGKYSLKVIGSADPLELTDITPGQRNLVLASEPFVWTDAEVGAAFDALWSVMDANYSYFFLKKDVDWQQLKVEYRPRAVVARNSEDLAAVLRDMLGHLHDMHVWVETAKGREPTYRSSWSYNGNMKVVRSRLDHITECGKYAIVGRTKQDGFGYFLMLSQSDATPNLVQQAADAIAKFHDAPGFIVDLRIANGGSEPLATQIASLFCAKDVVYAKSKYRNGPAHDAFTPEFPRTLAASSDPYTKPVVCLIGPGAISSGENFVQMMQALPKVKTVGLPTRGASGNPQPAQVGRTGVKVYFSRWVDLMPDGKPFEEIGIAPMIKVDLPAAVYQDEDPTLDEGIEVLGSQP